MLIYNVLLNYKINNDHINSIVLKNRIKKETCEIEKERKNSHLKIKNLHLK